MTGALLNLTGNADTSGVYRSSEDSAWLMACAMVILTMQGGFALLESGSVTHVNSANILFKNLADMCIGALGYWMIGWGLAYGKAEDPAARNGFMGTGEFFPEEADFVMWFFQFSFAATASTIDSGVVVERINIKVYLALSFFVSAVVYPIVTHWAWSDDGWLFKMGYVDFAGSGVVHLVGGGSALIATTQLKPRLGYLGNEWPHDGSLPFPSDYCKVVRDVFKGETVNALFGVLILWFAWYAFNAGSVLTIADGNDIVAGRTLFTTTIAPSAAAAMATCLTVAMTSFSLLNIIAGSLLAGLVSITACTHRASGIGSCIIGAIASLIFIGSKLLLARLKIDDPVDAIPVHFACGIFGVIATGIFALPVPGDETAYHGIVYGGNPAFLGVQCLGALVITAWSMGTTLLFFMVTKYVFRVNIRVTPSEEFLGLDLVEHGVDHYGRILSIEKLRSAMADKKVQETKGKMTERSRSKSRAGMALREESDLPDLNDMYKQVAETMKTRRRSSSLTFVQQYIAPAQVAPDSAQRSFRGSRSKSSRSSLTAINDLQNS